MAQPLGKVKRGMHANKPASITFPEACQHSFPASVRLENAQAQHG
jgi:hypothetical protein